MSIPEKLLKPYNPNETEDRIYKLWEESGFFNPDTCIKKGVTDKNAPPFSIVLPPPNVTGELHMGHAAMLAIEDIMIRFKRMQGFKTLWVPGTDHAAIATQSRVEKILEKEGKKRRDMSREEFLKRVDDFAQKSHDTIVNQVKKMGSSLDWSREAFTLDEKRTLAVRTAFKQMYDLGLIYRGNRVINWDPKGQTVISDDEVVHEERKAKFYTFKYSKDFPISISTTRPETKVGDTAVAVNPKDARYKKYVGKEYDINFAGAKIHIKIIADDKVDIEFGTGALGVTPAHSMADWEIAQRHDLPLVQVINEFAKMSIEVPELKNKKVTEAREIIVEWLKKENLLEKEEEISQNISTAERTGAIIEPLPKLQWFVAVNKKFKLPHSEIKGVQAGTEISLKELMLKSVQSGQIKIIPEHFEKTYFHWIENLRDWCISRQIWYGHRIPVWYKNDEIYVGIEAPSGTDWAQDEDTLDTWFSSGQWPFATLQTTKHEDFEYFYPTSVMNPAYDILPFWVIRMVMLGLYVTGEPPFKEVLLHGLVRDKFGVKISKSKGNIINPIEMVQKYGADALRVALIWGSLVENDNSVSEENIKGQRNFANKIWNVSRFVLMSPQAKKAKRNEDDLEIIKHLKFTSKRVTKLLEKYRLNEAAEELYDFVWHKFADVYIEKTKGRREEAQKTLELVLQESLKLLHPFMPFVTEVIWQEGAKRFDSPTLISAPWPKS